jgi:predicted metal-dependent phosphoesterase TrpH
MLEGYINCELHCHTFHSPCSSLSFDKIIKECRRKKIDALAITDHNTITGALEFSDYAPENLRIIISEEVATEEGEVIGYFIKENIKKGKSLLYTIEAIKEQGGLVSIPHPFDSLRRGTIFADSLEKYTDNIDMIEVFNSRMLFNSANKKALKFASKHNLTPVCGSDAHIAYEVGKSILKIKPFTTASEFKRNLEKSVIQGIKSPLFVHFFTIYNKYVKNRNKPQQ